MIDQVCGRDKMDSIRSCYVPHAKGRVLEIGLGSGHNLSHYTSDVTYIDAVDPLKELTALAKNKIALAMPPVEIHTTVSYTHLTLPTICSV